MGFSAPLQKALVAYPPNWWVGMEAPVVELMIYAQGVGDDSVVLRNGNGNVASVTQLDSPNYLFVTLDTKHAEEGDVVLAFRDEDGSERILHYPLLSRSEGARQRKGFGPEDAIYLIAPDRFANGSTTNDNIPGYADKAARSEKGGRHGGDIQGIIEHLDYIEELGFTQIWSMPLLENAMNNYSYHGYSITDHYQIDPRYGSNDDYVALSEAASQRGIGLIMDMVLNHIGSHHIWMQDMPSADWINNGGKFVGTSHKRETLHDPHVIESDKKGFSDGWFVPTMPDLNQRNPHLANYLIQNAIWWVEYANLSGIRVDTYSYSDKDFLSQWTSRLMEEYPNLNIVGEEWSVNPAITSYWQAGSYRHDGYHSALPSVMDFPLQAAVVRAVNSEERWDAGFINLYETLATDFLYGDANNVVIFPDNHDMSRIYTQVDHDLNKWNMAMTVFLTTRGIPQVFYGTEILMQNGESDDHGIIRTDFPGGWSEDEGKNGFTGEGLNKDERWAQERVKQLLSLRKTHPQFFKGEMKHYAPDDGVYTFFRTTGNVDDGMLMVVLNKKKIVLDLGKYGSVLSGYTRLSRLRDGKTFGVGETLTLEPMSATVFVVSAESSL
ncbi:alpha-amylase family glycosyl hydrolase [Aestuariibacter sp. A3R04]|uniref:alpha-amylase family glycosyl hydrolase n=1 Tax=Aestuariibacter sp. A3R04 TaxID=2841571 RepID=UPI001C0A10BA|nr:alpha-amylase family glycosyl hydrolase [Aestuariibacter sp. A3R04]MBU3021807.1 glycoside hydrolase family 13 protein [Aestuariibacter sp. A3R04]